MKLDKLKLNSDKTEIILVGTRPQLGKSRFDHLKVGDIEVPVATTAVRNLGAWFDCNLSMSTHIPITSANQFITSSIISDKYGNFQCMTAPSCLFKQL